MSYEQERRARALDLYKKMGWGENEGVKEAGATFKDEK